MRLPYLEQGAPDGAPVVLLHAYVDSMRFWEPVFARLPAGVHAFAPSLRGHGDAPRPDRGYALTDFAADVVGFMDEVGLESATLVGQSSGGYVAQRMAVDHPERVEGLILVASPRDFRDKPAELVDAMSELTDPIDPAFIERFVDGTIGSTVDPAHRRTLLAETAKPPARVWRETLKGLLDADIPVESGTIMVPTLIIAGARDDVCPLAEQRALAAAIPGARLVVYEDAGHLVAAEAPERVAEEIAAFTSRPAAARP